MNSSNSAYKYGSLPANAALAAAYVPIQKSVNPSYDSCEALSRGTLFPGLDLPFMNVVNNNLKPSPLNELMAICFVADELELYLDTHPDDTEAFSMYQTFLDLADEAHKRYAEKYGPLLQKDMMGMRSYAWLDDPWPWDYQPKMEV